MCYTYDLSNTGFNLTFGDGTSPVGYFAANGYGLYDMAGNAFQWCWDWYDGSWYSNAGATQNDTRGPMSGSNRVHRGGGFNGYARDCRTANRNNYNGGPAASGSYFGFRSVLSPGQ